MTAAAVRGRIDVHQHFFPDASPDNNELRQRMEEDFGGRRFPVWRPEDNLSAMDDLGIERAILSMPGNPGGGPDSANRKFARLLNRVAFRACEKYPDRFGFFANLPLSADADAAVTEMRYALDELGAAGVGLVSSFRSGEDAHYLGSDAMDPLWEELDRRRALVFVHGAQTPNSNRIPNQFLPVPISEVPNETFKTAADLVTTGKKRRFPNARIILAHAGGTTPFVAARAAVLGHALGCPLTVEEILEDFRSFYFEIALAGFSTDLLALEDFTAADHILFGTDCPAPPITADVAAWYTNRADEFFADRPDRLQAIMRDNALVVLR